MLLSFSLAVSLSLSLSLSGQLAAKHKQQRNAPCNWPDWRGSFSKLFLPPQRERARSGQLASSNRMIKIINHHLSIRTDTVICNWRHLLAKCHSRGNKCRAKAAPRAERPALRSATFAASPQPSALVLPGNWSSVAERQAPARKAPARREGDLARELAALEPARTLGSAFACRPSLWQLLRPRSGRSSPATLGGRPEGEREVGAQASSVATLGKPD